jgi:hypothetical protein
VATPSRKPAAKRATGTASKRATGTASKRATGTASKRATGTASKRATGTASKRAARPAAGTATEPASKPVTEPEAVAPVKPIAEPAPKPIAEPAPKPITVPAAKPVVEIPASPAQKSQEQLVSSLEQGQELLIDAAQSWVNVFSALPVMDLPKIPGLTDVRNMQALTNFAFDIAGDLLTTQREFALELAKVLLPAKTA